MRSLIRRFIPRWILALYHRFLILVAAVINGFPADNMIVIGVTGTNGKSTTVDLIAHICEEAGYTVGSTSTVGFKIGKKEWLNTTKMTMLGRFALQRLLKQMVRAGCEIAVVETSSEGITQNRHLHISYDVAVFTNLTPEHIESHGSYQAYRAAKGELFATLAHTKKKMLRSVPVPKTIVLNVMDAESPFFRSFPAAQYIGFMLQGTPIHVPAERLNHLLDARDIDVLPNGSRFTFDGARASLQLPGRVNVENALAAIAAVQPLGISQSTAIRALAKVTGVPGRFEYIQQEPFAVLVDYAPEPASLTQLYEFLATLHYTRIIHVLGSTGGGRDTARRPILGEIAGKHAAIVIVTNEDPYDDDPNRIIAEVSAGAEKTGKIPGKDVLTILDRRMAIVEALARAEVGDLVLVTGKGSEQAMVVAGGKKIPWDDRAVIRDILKTTHVKKAGKNEN